MLTVVLSLLFFLIPNIISQIIPFRLDSAIEQLRQQQRYTRLDLNNYADYNLTPKQMRERMSLFLSSNKTNTCEQDFEMILQAALNRDMWAIKVIDAWGKPLPSGILSGNTYWVGNYDECLQDLYVPDNKSFVSQPFNTQYCMYIYLNIEL